MDRPKQTEEKPLNIVLLTHSLLGYKFSALNTQETCSYTHSLTHSLLGFTALDTQETHSCIDSLRMKDSHGTQATSQWIAARCLWQSFLRTLGKRCSVSWNNESRAVRLSICVTGEVCQWIIPNHPLSRRYTQQQTVRLSVFTLQATQTRASQRHGDVPGSQEISHQEPGRVPLFSFGL